MGANVVVRVKAKTSVSPLSPTILVRDDLKQYTAEAFACLVLRVLVARIENEWHVRRLVAIAATTCIGL